MIGEFGWRLGPGEEEWVAPGGGLMPHEEDTMGAAAEVLVRLAALDFLAGEEELMPRAGAFCSEGHRHLRATCPNWLGITLLFVADSITEDWEAGDDVGVQFAMVDPEADRVQMSDADGVPAPVALIGRLNNARVRGDLVMWQALLASAPTSGREVADLLWFAVSSTVLTALKRSMDAGGHDEDR